MWACIWLLFSSNLNLYLPRSRGEDIFSSESFLQLSFFTPFHPTRPVRLAALSAEMEILGEPSGPVLFILTEQALI